MITEGCREPMGRMRSCVYQSGRLNVHAHQAHVPVLSMFSDVQKNLRADFRLELQSIETPLRIPPWKHPVGRLVTWGSFINHLHWLRSVFFSLIINQPAKTSCGCPVPCQIQGKGLSIIGEKKMQTGFKIWSWILNATYFYLHCSTYIVISG